VKLARDLLLALWAGGLVTVALLVAPVLFQVLSDRHLAGQIAGEYFRIATLASLAFGVAGAALGARLPAADRGLPLAAAGLLAASEWLVRPALEAARGPAGAVNRAFMAWHALSTLLYALATLCVVWALVRALRHPGGR
jgi:hypothetical protein